jgi:LmbE family N-acetylglucosaminyl deacetylase
MEGAKLTSENKKKVMIIMAHPDDGEFGAGGTLAKWAREGHEIYYTLCTSGDKGTSDPAINSNELTATRELEQQNAAKVIGAQSVAFLKHTDGELINNETLRQDISREIRRIKPDIVICQDPTNRFGDNHINHPDHRAAGDAALDSIYPSARDYHAFPQLIKEGFMPHNVLEVYLTGPGGNNPKVIDISSSIDIKINALLEHRSQVGSDNPERVEGLMSRVKERAGNLGKEHGVEFAEIFRYIALGR